MYKSDFFFADDKKEKFCPTLISVFNISADNSYYHLCDDEEKSKQGKNAVAFIRCINGSGKIRFDNKEIEIHKNEYVFIKFYHINDYKSTSSIWEYRWINFLPENTESDYKLGKIYSAPFCENEDKAFQKLLTLGKSEAKHSGYINSLFLNYYYTVTLENRLNIAENGFAENNELIDEYKNSSDCSVRSGSACMYLSDCKQTDSIIKKTYRIKQSINSGRHLFLWQVSFVLFGFSDCAWRQAVHFFEFG